MEMNQDKNIRTRVAPSPTGYPHIGTIYQALFDKTYALKNNGKFIMRIEDTDQERFVKGAEDALYKALEWFGLNPDESPSNPGAYGPYRQSERLSIYREFADKLVHKGFAYYCFCSKSRLEEVRNSLQKEGKPPMYDKHCRHITKEESEKRINNGEAYVIRMKIPENTKIIVNDLIRGEIEFDSNLIDDQVILKADGFPTYHLAVIVDDFLMKITHVIRGPEWLTSFPKHKLLADYLEIEAPIYIHTPMICNPDGSKLSKRQGHSSVDWYRFRGYLPEAVLNFISLLGWSHPDEKEIFDYEEFVKVFDIADISAVSPKMDLVKLEWMNGQYIQKLNDIEFIQKLSDWLGYCINNEYKGANVYESEWNQEYYSLFLNFINSLDSEKKKVFFNIVKERIKKFEDIRELCEFFIKDINYDEILLCKYKSHDEVIGHIKWFVSNLESIDWNLESLKKLEIDVGDRANELGWKLGEVFYPLRVAITGKTISPPLFESIYILGKEKVLSKLKGLASIN